MPTANVNGTMLHYSFDGPDDRPVVMLCNALGTDLGMWDPTVPALTSAGYQVLRYDRRGHGKSGTPLGPYTLEMLTDDALGLMDELGLQRVNFCGLSIGGMVGQILGAEYGDRLLSLTLCDTSPHAIAAISWDDRIAAVRNGGMAAVLEGTIDRWITKPGQERLPEVIQRVTEMILGTSVEGFVGCNEALRILDNRARLPLIKVRTAIIVGEEDHPTPVATSQYIHEQVPNSTLAVIPEAAHLSNMEQPTAFNNALLKHLQAHQVA